jgi:hypothetical protein
MSDDNRARVWTIVKQWPGGKIEPVMSYRDEQKARHAAGQLIGREACWIVLWDTLLADASRPYTEELETAISEATEVVEELTRKMTREE